MSAPREFVYPSIHDHTVNDASGNPISLSKYKGNVCVIVNVSCQSQKAEQTVKKLYLACGALQGKGVKLLLFPCYQFGAAVEFNVESEFVQNHCHGVGTLFEPIDVNGVKASSLYTFLKSKKLGKSDSIISEDFTVFVANQKGIPIERFSGGFSVDLLKDSINSCYAGDLQFYGL